LLVVMAIISVLAGMLVPILERSLDSARTIACTGNQKQLATGMLMYTGDNNEYFPYMNSGAAGTCWDFQIANYVDYKHKGAYAGIGPALFRCPKSKAYIPMHLSVNRAATR